MQVTLNVTSICKSLGPLITNHQFSYTSLWKLSVIQIMLFSKRQLDFPTGLWDVSYTSFCGIQSDLYLPINVTNPCISGSIQSLYSTGSNQKS